MLALRSEFACSNCRTLSTLRRVSIPRMPGCPTKLRPTGLERLQSPLGRSRRTTSCVSFLFTSSHAGIQYHARQKHYRICLEIAQNTSLADYSIHSDMGAWSIEQ